MNELNLGFFLAFHFSFPALWNFASECFLDASQCKKYIYQI